MVEMNENQKAHSYAEVLPDLSRLKDYTRAKQTVAHEIRTLAGFLKNHLGERNAEECRQLMAQLAEDRFALAVVGQFKRGKSSLMNAIIGRDLLPTGVLPLTSAITVLKYGHRERLLKGLDGHWRLEELDCSELTTEIEALTGIERRLDSIRMEMLKSEPACGEKPSVRPTVQAPRFTLPSAGEQERLERVAKQTAGVKATSDLGRDLNTRGCPVCNRMADTASRFLASWQYALASQEDAQRAFAASLGFCPLHTWQLEALASPQGLSVGYPNLMERLAMDLSRLATSEHPAPADSVLALVQKPGDCRVCHLIQESEAMYLEDLVDFIQSPEGHKAYTHSQGVCLRHLGVLLAAIPSQEVVRFLIEHAARRFAEISEDMQNYALKRDALRGHTKNLDEDDAYLRGLIHSAGAKKVCFPWELDPQV